MSRRIILNEGRSRVIRVNYDLDPESLMRMAGIPKTVRDKTLLSVKYHINEIKGTQRIEVRDVCFSENVDFNYAVSKIKRHDPEAGWNPVGIFEFLHYISLFPDVYMHRMVYALGHVYNVDGHDHLVSATDDNGVLDFELLHFIRTMHRFSTRSIFPEFRIIR